VRNFFFARIEIALHSRATRADLLACARGAPLIRGRGPVDPIAFAVGSVVRVSSDGDVAVRPR
jgi:hypothetical protein